MNIYEELIEILNELGIDVSEDGELFDMDSITFITMIIRIEETFGVINDFKKRNSIITAIAPNSPNSSHIMEKIISFCASGRNPSFCILSPRPLPKMPPEPIAYNACKV